MANKDPRPLGRQSTPGTLITGPYYPDGAQSPITWMTPTPPLVFRAAVAGAIVFALGFPPPADAASTDSSGQLFPIQSIHNAPIAGPMVAGDALGWLPRPQDRMPLPVEAADIEYAGPLTVPSTPGVNWLFTRPPDPVRPPDVAGRTGYAPPVYVASGWGAWSARRPDPVLVPPVIQSSLALPLPSAPLLPWLVTGLPSILPPWPVRSVFALNPTTPAPQTVLIPWLVPPGALVFRPVARYEAVYAKPIQPLDPSGRSDLPWLLTGAPLVRAPFLIQSSLALNPTTPSAAITGLPWPTVPPLIQAPGRAHLSLIVRPVTPALVSAWWPTGPDAPRLILPVVSRLVSPIRPLDPSGRSDLPWLMQAPPGRAVPTAAIPSRYAYVNVTAVVLSYPPTRFVDLVAWMATTDQATGWIANPNMTAWSSATVTNLAWPSTLETSTAWPVVIVPGFGTEED